MNIVVTGGTDGIGLALVKKLLSLEHRVMMIGKNSKKAEKILSSLNNSKLEFFECDLSEKKEINKLIKKLDNVSTDEKATFWFDPAEVWEIRGADLTLSPVHHAARTALNRQNEMFGDDSDQGISLRFPRFQRIRGDKQIEEATSSTQILALFNGQPQRQEA